MKISIKSLSKRTLKTASGFTLIEFSIVLAILAIFLIIILQISNNTIAIYQKGLSVKAISTAGRDLLDEFTRTVNASPTGNLDVLCNKLSGNAKTQCLNHTDGFPTKLVYNRYPDNTESQQFGMFCTGKYSYFWNSGDALKAGNTKTVKINGANYNGSRLLRIEDPDYELCLNYIKNRNNLAVSHSQGSGSPVDLLQNSEDLPVALFDFTIFPPSQDNTISRIFYSGTFVVGTLKGDAQITARNDYCGDVNINSLSSDFSYCAINKFNFAAQALGGQNE